MPKVRKIHVRPQALSVIQPGESGTTTGLRVAAYARVSTEQESQSNSFQAQKDYYEKLIGNTPSWTYAGIYADRGISGTSTDHREGFQAMMEDCRAGKIDRILTKSVSRFARNTVDSLNAIRELKALGIGIEFQKEGIFTLDSKGEFLITVMSSLSQEESRSISENVRWGVKKRMADGKYSVNFSFFLGYDRGSDGRFVINENEAHIVRYIFRYRLMGYSTTEISKQLMELGVPAPAGGKTWSPSVVCHILSNEKMKGDALLQKSYTKDFLSKKVRKNKGELQQFYVSGGHEAIVEPALFDYVQTVLSDQNSGMYPWKTRLICGKCGKSFRIKQRHGKVCWECRDSYRKENPCKNTYVYEMARAWHVKEVMRRALKPEVVEDFLGIIEKKVKDPERKEKVGQAVQELLDKPAEALFYDDEDFLLATKEIRFFPENVIRAEMIDGSVREMALNPCWPEKERKRKKKAI